jgi:hypothetical protein
VRRKNGKQNVFHLLNAGGPESYGGVSKEGATRLIWFQRATKAILLKICIGGI